MGPRPPSKDPIVVAVDGSKESAQALDRGCELAKALGRPLVLVTVVPPPPIYPGGYVPVAMEPVNISQSYQDALEAAEKRVKAQGMEPSRVELMKGPVVDSILDLLKATHPYLVVMGARGLSTGARLFLGSVSDGIVHHAPCPVLVVRPADQG